MKNFRSSSLKSKSSQNLFKGFKNIQSSFSNEFSSKENKKYKGKEMMDTTELMQGLEQAWKIVSRYYDKDFKNPKIKAYKDFEPGFIRNSFSNSPPEKAEALSKIIEDTEKYIIPGIRQWQHPRFFAYFPSTISHQALIADFIANAFLAIGFTWHSSPANTELENLVCDWVVKMLGLPEKFMISSKGGGMLANTIGDGIFTGVLAAKHKKMKELGITTSDTSTLGKFVGYYSEHCHMQVFKALHLKDISHIRALPVEFDKESQNFKLKDSYIDVIEEDVKNGLIPFFFGSCIGTTSTGAFDDIAKISEICKKHNIFLLTDCAWAGSYFVMPEYQYLSKSLEYANCVCINFCKTLMSGPNTAAFYIDDKILLSEATAGKYSSVNPNPEYLKNKYTNQNDIIDYKDWQIGLGRKFSSIKVFYVIRSFGLEGLREVLNNSIKLATYFNELISKDSRFSLFCKQSLGLVCIRLVKINDQYIKEGDLNRVNQELVDLANSTLEVFLTGGKTDDKYYIRCSFSPTWNMEDKSHVLALYNTLSDCVEMIKI